MIGLGASSLRNAASTEGAIGDLSAEVVESIAPLHAASMKEPNPRTIVDSRLH